MLRIHDPGDVLPRLRYGDRATLTLDGHVLKSTIVEALGGLLSGFDTAVISGTPSSAAD